MKWLKSRQAFLNEAKIKDVILARQAEQVKKIWGEAYLEQEEVTPTDKIKQGSWILSEEDKRKVLSVFFDVDLQQLYELFQNLSDRFCQILKASIKTELLTADKSKFISVLSRFDIKEPSIDEIYLLYENVFRKLSVGETKATESIQRDENGRPILGEDNKPVKVAKASGDPIFTNNLVNINSFIADYNACFPDEKVNDRLFTTGIVYNIRNAAGVDVSAGEYTIDFEIFKRDLILQILHKPSDILNISISKFYASCQHLYTGAYRNQVLSNVFDPNSIPAFLKFDTPIYWKGEKISDQLPLSRMQIRNIEGFSSTPKEPKIYFDRCYPDKMQTIMEEMVTKYSGNVKNFKEGEKDYLFTPDIEPTLQLSGPYMDRLGITTGKYIGKNCKTLYLSIDSNWENVVVAPNANIKELIIETVKVPVNLLELELQLDWVKFKYLKIKHLDVFKFKTESYSFDKCRFLSGVVKEIRSVNGNIQKLSFISCDIPDLELSSFHNLEEVELIYTLEDGQKLVDVLGNLKLRKLRVSGDVLSIQENKKFIQDLRRSGTKVETVGLVI